MLYLISTVLCTVLEERSTQQECPAVTLGTAVAWGLADTASGAQWYNRHGTRQPRSEWISDSVGKMDPIPGTSFGTWIRGHSGNTRSIDMLNVNSIKVTPDCDFILIDQCITQPLSEKWLFTVDGDQHRFSQLANVLKISLRGRQIPKYGVYIIFPPVQAQVSAQNEGRKMVKAMNSFVMESTKSFQYSVHQLQLWTLNSCYSVSKDLSHQGGRCAERPMPTWGSVGNWQLLQRWDSVFLKGVACRGRAYPRRWPLPKGTWTTQIGFDIAMF